MPCYWDTSSCLESCNTGSRGSEGGEREGVMSGREGVREEGVEGGREGERE